MHQLIKDNIEKWEKVINNLKTELKLLRSDRATPALIEGIKIDYYGTLTPLQQIATISTPEPRQLLIEPWDKNILKDIEVTLQKNDSNFSIINDGSNLRINLPAMTEETRKSTVIILNKKSEDARVSIRRIREEILKEAKREKEGGNMSEDDFFIVQKDVQEKVDDFNKQIKDLGDEKEKEIMTV